jgi:tetratricopeptide (TPR) repeat protein
MDSTRRTMSSDVARYVEKLRKKWPDVRAYEEDDFTWTDEGLDHLDLGEYELAERTFQWLVLSQPNHFDGYEGLALVYEAMGKRAEAVMMIGEAVRLAAAFLEKKDIDPEVFEEVLEEYRRIMAMPEHPVPPEPDFE